MSSSRKWIKDHSADGIAATEEESYDANAKADQLLKLPLSSWKTDTVPKEVSIAYLVDAVNRETTKLERFVCFVELKVETTFGHFCFVMSYGTTIQKIYGWKEVGE